MSELKNFEKLYNNIISESANFENRFVQEINDCDAFYRAYIEPLANKYEIISEKQRYNVFRLHGLFNGIKEFFARLKVNKEFLIDRNNNKIKFQIFEPLVCLNQVMHEYNNGEDTSIFDRTHSEGNELIDAGQRVDTTRLTDDYAQSKFEGRWYNLFDNTEKNTNVPDFNVPKHVYACEPKEMVKLLTNFLTEHQIKDKDNVPLTVEFSVNCDKLPNNCYGELAKQVPITFNGSGSLIKDIADAMNDPNKMTEPIAKCKLPLSNEKPLIGDNEKFLKTITKISADKKNKVKTKKV